jgi:hypothetical protein
MLVGRIDQLGQQAATVAALRVRSGAAGAPGLDLAHVLQLLPLVVPDRDQSRPAIAAERCRGTGEEAIVFAFVAELETEGAVLAVFQIIGWVLGLEGNHPAQRVGAVQGAARATHHFHALERVEVDEVAVGVGETADGERFGYRDAIGFHPHAVAAQAADADVAQAEAANVRSHRDARLVAEQVFQVAGDLPVHFLAVDRGDRGRHVLERTLGARGRDHDAAELVDSSRSRGKQRVGLGWRRACAGLRLRGVGGSGDSEIQGRGQGQGQGASDRLHACGSWE